MVNGKSNEADAHEGSNGCSDGRQIRAASTTRVTACATTRECRTVFENGRRPSWMGGGEVDDEGANGEDGVRDGH